MENKLRPYNTERITSLVIDIPPGGFGRDSTTCFLDVLPRWTAPSSRSDRTPDRQQDSRFVEGFLGAEGGWRLVGDHDIQWQLNAAAAPPAATALVFDVTSVQ
jgi:hypothetical protein